MPNRRKPKNKKKHKKGKRENDSESSTPHSSTPSVEDERQRLIQGGACASSDSRESRATEKTENARRTGSGKSPYRSTSETSRNSSQSDHSSKTNLLAVPDEEIGACGPRSPSRNPFSLLKNVLASKKKSPNCSSGFKCSCSDKKQHQPECPILKNLLAQARDEGSEDKTEEMGVNESKPPSSGASPILSNKNKDCTQSSSSSDPSVAENSKNSSEPAQSLENNLPSVLDQGSGACGENSPSKKSPLNLLRSVFKSKKSSPNLSTHTKPSFENKTKRETGTKSKRPIGSRTKSEASSSGSSTSWKNKGGNSSNVSSENSRHSSTKSSNNSDPFVELSCSDESGRSENQNENIGQDRIPIIQHMDEDHGSIPRCRSKSLSLLGLLQSVNSPHSSPGRYDLRNLGIQLRKIEWSWLEQIRRPMHSNVDRTSRVNDPDENERGLLRGVEAVRPDPSRRHVSLSPVRVRDCNCGAGNDGIDHNIGCSRNIDLRRRRNLRRCRQSPRR